MIWRWTQEKIYHHCQEPILQTEDIDSYHDFVLSDEVLTLRVKDELIGFHIQSQSFVRKFRNFLERFAVD